MRWSNSIAIFQGDVVFMIEYEIPEVANVFIDDIGVKRPPTHYETADGYETIPENHSIQLFVWQHLGAIHHVLHHLAFFGATVSGSKMFICVPEVMILGHIWSYDTGWESRFSDQENVLKMYPKTSYFQAE